MVSDEDEAEDAAVSMSACSENEEDSDEEDIFLVAACEAGACEKKYQSFFFA